MESQLEPSPLNFRWSPDGHSIAVVGVSPSGSGSPLRVWIVPDDGSGPREMAVICELCTGATGPPGWTTDVAWSPDSRQIAAEFVPANGQDDIREDAEANFQWTGSVESGRLEWLRGTDLLDLFGWLDDETLLMADRIEGQWFAVPLDQPRDRIRGPPTGADGRRVARREVPVR